MRSSLLKVFLAVGLVGWSGAASAIFTAGLYVGQRSGDFSYTGDDEKSITATDYTLSLLLDPIPLVPIGFGVSVNVNDYDVNPDDHGLTEMPGLLFIPEVKGWLPMVPYVTPYGRIGYVLGGYKPKVRYTLPTSDTVDIDAVYTTTGFAFGVGVEYSPVPLLSLALEVNMTQQKLDPQDFKYTDPSSGLEVELNQIKETDFNTTAFLLGLTIGI